MRRQNFTQLIGTLVAAAVVVGLPATAFALIENSAHDLSAQSYTDEICNVCHTPHNATTETAAPLWDHTVTSASYTVYTSTTLNASPGQPSGVSKLCLSCHDGSVAIDAFAGSSGSVSITGNALVGSDLKNDHPVSFTYNTALATADGELFDPASATTSIGGTIEADLLFGTAGSKTVECASCHDVHNARSNSYLLQINNVDSDLCLTCHNK